MNSWEFFAWAAADLVGDHRLCAAYCIPASRPNSLILRLIMLDKPTVGKQLCWYPQALQAPHAWSGSLTQPFNYLLNTVTDVREAAKPQTVRAYGKRNFTARMLQLGRLYIWTVT